MATTRSGGRRGSRSLLLGLLVAANRCDPAHPFAPPERRALHNRAPTTTALGQGPGNSNWRVNEDGFTEYVGPTPPRRGGRGGGQAGQGGPGVGPGGSNHQAGNPNGQYQNVNNSQSNVGKANFQQTSTDDFKRPHGSVPPPQYQQQQQQPRMDNTYRHKFQTISTDDFKRPHGMPPEMEHRQAQPPPRQGNAFKAPFQTSTTADFKRSHDEASGVGAPQQESYGGQSRSDRNVWSNSVGQDSYESTRARPHGQQYNQQQQQQQQSGNHPPQQPTQQPGRQPPRDFFDAEIIDDQQAELEAYQRFTQQQQQQQQSHANAPLASNTSQDPVPLPLEYQQTLPPPPNTEQQNMEAWDKKFQVAQVKSSRTLLHGMKFPTSRDPAGDARDYPSLPARAATTILATVIARHLHLLNGCSPVMACSAVALVVSTCLDQRLGRAALCGAMAGMSGGHLVPNVQVAAMLGAGAAACYELLIHVNNLCLGIGGRVGATAFLATSLLAKYRRVNGVGRKLRRGMWKNGAGPSTILTTMVLFHALGSLATIFLREASDDSAAADPVRASSVVGLLGSMFLKDPTAVLALYGGSFVGMSAPSRLMHGNERGKPQTAPALFTTFAGAGAIAGLMHAMTVHYGYWNGGWGGKVGLCAFAGCWLYRGFGNVYQFLQQKA